MNFVAAIKTLLGDIEEEDLVVEETREPAVCGESVTRRYFYKDELVRQDCTVEIHRGVILGGKGGY